MGRHNWRSRDVGADSSQRTAPRPRSGLRTERPGKKQPQYLPDGCRKNFTVVSEGSLRK